MIPFILLGGGPAGVVYHTRHYWIDVKTVKNGDGQAITQAAFFPVALARDHEPTSLASLRDRPSDYSNVMLGCNDGYVRRFQADTTDDDGLTFDSYVDLVTPLAGDGTEAVLAEIQGVVAEDSGNVDWAVRVGKSAEAAFNAATFSSGTWTLEGVSYVAHPRARGKAALVRVSCGEDDTEWAIEEVVITVEMAGKLRR